jgi:hypothetical protein
MQRAHLSDGLPEITVGVLCLFFSGIILAPEILPRALREWVENAPLFVFFSLLILPVVVFAGGAARAMKWVRRRYLIARVGYVEFKPLSRKQIGIAIGIIVGAFMTIALFDVGLHWVRVPRPAGWLFIAMGLFWGALWAWLGRLPRFVIGGVLTGASALILVLSGVPLRLGVAILFGFQGLATLISGSLVFLHFIRLPVKKDD